MDVDRYLHRIRFDGPMAADLDTLERLMRSHLTAVPFENLDVFNGDPVGTDVEWSFDKVVDRGRGGWCFELNGVFSWLLAELGFEVRRLGAAVLLGGPTTLIDHLTLEVVLSEPHRGTYLIDVGFGDSFCRPLALNRSGPQDGGTGVFELIPSPEGLTLTRHDADGVPRPQYRFKRVTLTMADLHEPSQRLQDDPDAVWHKQAFATRYLDGGPDRVTLIGHRLKLERDGEVTNAAVGDDEWPEALERWFSLRAPLTGSPDRRPDTAQDT